MITASNALKNIFYKNTSVNISAGCVVEYNMNQMLDNIVVNYADSLEEEYFTTAEGGVNAYKKFFPIDSVVKPYRPLFPGVKYYITLQNDHPKILVAGKDLAFDDFRDAPTKLGLRPRLYYAGAANAYKYWVTPEGKNMDVTLRYSIATANVTQAYSTANTSSSTGHQDRVIYTTSTPHGFIVGDHVSISGTGSTAYNLTNKEIVEVPTPKKFVIMETVAASEVTGLSKIATRVDPSNGTAKPSKPAISNKIVIKFEKFHYLPSNCKVKIKYSDGTYNDGTNNGVTPITANISTSTGAAILYWNGSTWSSSAPSESQPISYANPKEIDLVNVYTDVSESTLSGRVIGLIEISARWQKDISNDVVTFTIQKESNADENSLLPVGYVTANSLNLDINRFNQNNLRVITYNREENWTTEPTINEAIYLSKGMQIEPFFKVFHKDGTVTDGSLKYDVVKQGVFYLDSHEIDTYGSSNIFALDNAKYLMETQPIDLILRDAPVTSIIMCILDTVGFTNYNFNLVTPDDKSIPNVKTWWTDDEKTAWEHIQELCRDIQMNAFFDENNILQFYSRDYMYSQANFSWNFLYENDGTDLANIVEFSKKELPSANEVLIKWRVPQSSLFDSSAEDLWTAPVSFLIAGGLRQKILSTTPAENVVFDVDTGNIINDEDSTSSTTTISSSFNFQGYFLLNSEIFEYDAIQYQYIPAGLTTIPSPPPTEWVASSADLAKIRSISNNDISAIKPTGKYRIKARALFGTSAATHEATSSGSAGPWTVTDEVWDS